MPLTPLMKAAKEEKFELVKELLKDGADGTATNEGFTALHYATSFNSKDLSLIQFLLEKYPALINGAVSARIREVYDISSLILFSSLLKLFIFLI